MKDRGEHYVVHSRVSHEDPALAEFMGSQLFTDIVPDEPA